MPQKNSIKTYYENAFYHAYNRGVEKRDIFLDRSDYLFFLHLLKTSLSPKQNDPGSGRGTISVGKSKYVLPRRKNFHLEIDLVCFCLMPNHYHFLLRQHRINSMTEFIRSISTSYVMYFNKKYGRVGSLFQGKFRAIDIDDETYLLWTSRYIHRNPETFTNYLYSSYDDFLSKRKTPWLRTSLLLDYFNSNLKSREKNYQTFVEDDKKESPLDLDNLLLE